MRDHPAPLVMLRQETKKRRPVGYGPPQRFDQISQFLPALYSIQSCSIQSRITANPFTASYYFLATYIPQPQQLRRRPPQQGSQQGVGQQTCTGTCLQTHFGTQRVTV